LTNEVRVEESMDVPQAQRLERPAWLNARTVLGLLLFFTSLLGAQRVLAMSDRTIGVWAAATDLAVDTVLQPEHLELSQVQLPPDVAGAYALEATDLVGAVVTRSVKVGELVPLAAVASEGSVAVGRSVTLPVTPEHAAGGDFAPGDRVDVFATFDADDVRARTILLVSGVEVVSTISVGGLVSGESAITGVTIAVPPEDAARVVFAGRVADIDVVPVTGAPSGTPNATVRGSDFR